MCPACLTAAALLAAGTGSAAGLAALLWRRRPAAPRLTPTTGE